MINWSRLFLLLLSQEEKVITTEEGQIIKMTKRSHRETGKRILSLVFPERISGFHRWIWTEWSEERTREELSYLRMVSEYHDLILRLIIDLADLVEVFVIWDSNIDLMIRRGQVGSFNGVIAKLEEFFPGQLVDDPTWDGIGTPENGFPGDTE